MPPTFDPYLQWLGIRDAERPPNHYRLLGIAQFEGDPNVIANAADRQMAHVRTFQSGKQAAFSQRLLNELAAARLCLLKPPRKAEYDAAIRAALPAAAVTAAAPVAGPHARNSGVAAPRAESRVAPAGIDAIADLAHSPRARRRPVRKQTSAVPFVLAALLLFAAAVAGWSIWGGADKEVAANAKPSADANTAPRVTKVPLAESKVEATPKPDSVNKQEPPGGAQPEEDSAPAPDSAPEKPAAEKPVAEKPVAEKPAAEKPAAEKPAAYAEIASQEDASETGGGANKKDGDGNSDRGASEPTATTAESDLPAPPEPPDPTKTERAPAPSVESQASALKQVRAVLKSDYAGAKQPAEKAALAEKLMKLADETLDDPATRYVLYADSRHAAVEGGRVDLALRNAKKTAQIYDVDPWQLSAEVLSAASGKAKNAEQKQALVEQSLALANQAVASDKYDAAEALLTAVQNPSLGPAQRKEIAARLADVKRQQTQWTEAQSAKAMLAKNAADPAANLAIGKYLCFVKGDFNDGLARLAKGSDATLASVARRDLEMKDGANEQSALGDAWWDLAENERGKAKGEFQRRALHWYEKAVGGLSGLSKTKVENRLKELAKELNPESGKPAKAVRPIARWSFENGARDSIGNLHGQLMGEAFVKGGRLKLNGQGYVETPLLASDLGERTFEAWVTLANLTQRGSAVLSVERASDRQFDAIVFAEAEPAKWMNGSGNLLRSQNVAGPSESAGPRKLVHVAIAYRKDGSIAIYRDGVPYGAPYTPAHAALMIYPANQTHMLIGLRHTGAGNGLFEGDVEEARLYDRALTDAEVADSFRAGP